MSGDCARLSADTTYTAHTVWLPDSAPATTRGPGISATVSRALATGFGPSFPLIAGLILGDIAYLLLAIFGLSAASRSMGSLFVLVDLCGGAYLVYLGIRLRITKPQPPRGGFTRSSGAVVARFAHGLIATLANPKVILFYGGFLPTFVDPPTLSPGNVLLLAAIVTAVLFSVLTVCAFFASRARGLSQSEPGSGG